MYEYLLGRLEPDDSKTSLIHARFNRVLLSWDANPKRARLEAIKALDSANLEQGESAMYLALVHIAALKLRSGELEVGTKLLDQAFALSISSVRLLHHIVRADELFIRGEMKKCRNCLETFRLKLKLRNDPHMTCV